MNYLQNTKNSTLQYSSSHDLGIVTYVDVDFPGNPRHVIYSKWLMGKLLRKTINASSTMQVAFVPYYEAIIQAMLLKKFVSGLYVVNPFLFLSSLIVPMLK